MSKTYTKDTERVRDAFWAWGDYYGSFWPASPDSPGFTPQLVADFPDIDWPTLVAVGVCDIEQCEDEDVAIGEYLDRVHGDRYVVIYNGEIVAGPATSIVAIKTAESKGVAPEDVATYKLVRTDY